MRLASGTRCALQASVAGPSLPSCLAWPPPHDIRGAADRSAGLRPARRSVAPPPGRVVIEFRGVSKLYEGGDVGLEDATSRSSRASSSSSSARPGSGKSTIMRLLIKELEPTRATIRVAGHDLAQIPRKQVPYYRPQPRRGLPGLQAAAQPHGPRQRRLRAAGHRRHAPRDPREGARHPAPDRALDQAAQLPRPALGRRAAARLGRARVRQPPAAAAGRRADRQPRPRDLDRDHAAALPHQPHRHDRARRHPRQRDGRPHAPPRDRASPRAASCATTPATRRPCLYAGRATSPPASRRLATLARRLFEDSR